MTIKLGSLKADLKRESDGDWVKVPDLPGVELKVRSTNYAPYQVALQAMIRRFRKRYGTDPVPPEEDGAETGKLYATHLLVDWRGFDVPYDAGTAMSALSDPAYRELRSHVGWAASQVGRIEAEFVEEAVGN